MVIAVMFAKWMGDALSKSQYEASSELQAIPFLEHHPPDATYPLTVSDMMARNVICVDIHASVQDVIQVMKYSDKLIRRFSNQTITMAFRWFLKNKEGQIHFRASF